MVLFVLTLNSNSICSFLSPVMVLEMAYLRYRPDMRPRPLILLLYNPLCYAFPCAYESYFINCVAFDLLLTGNAYSKGGYGKVDEIADDTTATNCMQGSISNCTSL